MPVHWYVDTRGPRMILGKLCTVTSILKQDPKRGRSPLFTAFSGLLFATSRPGVEGARRNRSARRHGQRSAVRDLLTTHRAHSSQRIVCENPGRRARGQLMHPVYDQREVLVARRHRSSAPTAEPIIEADLDQMQVPSGLEIHTGGAHRTEGDVPVAEVTEVVLGFD